MSKLTLDRALKMKRHIGLILVALLLSAAAFYWYEWRPREIKKTCSLEAIVQTMGGYGPEEPFWGTRWEEERDAYYGRCLRERGF